MSSQLIAALIGISGVALAGLLQWVVAKSVVRSETERLYRQLSVEFHQQRFSEWQERFQYVMAELLAATDPEAVPEFDKARIVSLVLKAQLMLNPEIPEHAKVNGLVNQLALGVSGWHGERDASNILRIHGQLLDSAKKTMYLPAKVAAKNG